MLFRLSHILIFQQQFNIAYLLALDAVTPSFLLSMALR